LVGEDAGSLAAAVLGTFDGRRGWVTGWLPGRTGVVTVMPVRSRLSWNGASA
jgi:hypothetical protein